MSADAAALVDLACRLAQAAGTAARRGRQVDADAGLDRGAVTAATKSSRTDVVTAHDRTAEAAIVSGLLDERPDDAIVGEEGTARTGTSGITWYVDPIDGTTNFLYGYPLWCTSIGAADEQGALAGAVYVPTTDELFAAARGAGATRNGRPIRCSDEGDVSLALVATGFAYDPTERSRQAAGFATLAGRVRDVRRGGSAAIDLCYTAAGFVDGYYERFLNPWDMAAGELIAREAGCRSGDFAGGPARPEELIVAAPGVFDALLALVAGDR